MPLFLSILNFKMPTLPTSSCDGMFCCTCPDKERCKNKDILDEWINGKVEDLTLKVKNTESGDVFSRKVTDVTEWEGIYIASW